MGKNKNLRDIGWGWTTVMKFNFVQSLANFLEILSSRERKSFCFIMKHPYMKKSVKRNIRGVYLAHHVTDIFLKNRSIKTNAA